MPGTDARSGVSEPFASAARPDAAAEFAHEEGLASALSNFLSQLHSGFDSRPDQGAAPGPAALQAARDGRLSAAHRDSAAARGTTAGGLTRRVPAAAGSEGRVAQSDAWADPAPRNAEPVQRPPTASPQPATPVQGPPALAHRSAGATSEATASSQSLVFARPAAARAAAVAQGGGDAVSRPTQTRRRIELPADDRSEPPEIDVDKPVLLLPLADDEPPVVSHQPPSVSHQPPSVSHQPLSVSHEPQLAPLEPTLLPGPELQVIALTRGARRQRKATLVALALAIVAAAGLGVSVYVGYNTKNTLNQRNQSLAATEASLVSVQHSLAAAQATLVRQHSGYVALKANIREVAQRYVATKTQLSAVQVELGQTQGQLGQTQGQLTQAQTQVDKAQNQLGNTQQNLSTTQSHATQIQQGALLLQQTVGLLTSFIVLENDYLTAAQTHNVGEMNRDLAQMRTLQVRALTLEPQPG